MFCITFIFILRRVWVDYFVACINKLVFSVSSSSKYSQIIVKYFQKVGGDIVKQVSFINLDIHDITA